MPLLSILHICYIVAMQAEAQPFIERFEVREVEHYFDPLPCKLYQTKMGDKTLSVVLNGQQHGSDLVGCEAASVATLAAIQRLQPDLVVNSGTCGAFAANGASIGAVYLGSSAMFHDRRVPGDDAWSTQGLGNYAVWEGTDSLAHALGYATAKVTTGSSLDMQPADEQIIRDNGGELKDMEGAAVAFVCSLCHVPVLFVKSVTDLVDHTASTYDDFRQNLALASQRLREANERVIQYLLQP